MTALPSHFVGTADSVAGMQFPVRDPVGADSPRSEELDPRNAAGPPIEDDVDATEGLATREGLDNADPGDLVGEPAVRVTGGDDVHQPMGQASRHLKDLRLGFAR